MKRSRGSVDEGVIVIVAIVAAAVVICMVVAFGDGDSKKEIEIEGTVGTNIKTVEIPQLPEEWAKRIFHLEMEVRDLREKIERLEEQ